MGASARRLAASFCGEVAGGDLNRLDHADSAAITAAWLAQKVLVFRDQSLDEDGLVAFAGRLGEVGIAFPAELRAPF